MGIKSRQEGFADEASVVHRMNIAIHQVPVVQRPYNAIQQISVDKTNLTVHWIVIYLMDSVI